MSVLEFEVNPENSLKNEHVELVLGAPINQVLTAIRNASKAIKNVELIYCNKEPFGKDITLLLKDDGIRLLFDAETQLLKLIEVYDFRKISLRYGNTTFSSPDLLADVSKVENCFGATHPGVYDEKHKTYLLHWRGVSFSFPAKEPSTVQPAYAHGLSSLNFSSLPHLEKMEIYQGNSPNEIRVPETPISIHCGNIFAHRITSIYQGNEILGVKIVISGEDNKLETRKQSNLPQIEKRIMFGDSEENVLSSLGAPSRVFYKSDEKMLIQKGSDSKKFGDADSTDMFYNYFSLGLMNRMQPVTVARPTTVAKRMPSSLN
ncbi:unnamed protein product [Bursaphelenchus okinawaensis]|uniref:Uncharacterized protein n=1 Tax=Bursaphelenchus okinawaensis TaxID=465554 RepID=A0A811JUA3_9BILA|nr:unnamed protein product [Bursaphelenchus okinawaensis]CAG9082783.1 unnamed protein product [Bursaphelenchus okinawaensis]